MMKQWGKMRSTGIENFETKLYSSDRWDTVESVEPDEIDLQMLREMQADPDCNTFASDPEVQAILG